MKFIISEISQILFSEILVSKSDIHFWAPRNYYVEVDDWELATVINNVFCWYFFKHPFLPNVLCWLFYSPFLEWWINTINLKSWYAILISILGYQELSYCPSRWSRMSNCDEYQSRIQKYWMFLFLFWRIEFWIAFAGLWSLASFAYDKLNKINWQTH